MGNAEKAERERKPLKSRDSKKQQVEVVIVKDQLDQDVCDFAVEFDDEKQSEVDTLETAENKVQKDVEQMVDSADEFKDFNTEFEVLDISDNEEESDAVDAVKSGKSSHQVVDEEKVNEDIYLSNAEDE